MIQGSSSQSVNELFNEILWKLSFVVIVILMLQSGHKFAHVMTA